MSVESSTCATPACPGSIEDGYCDYCGAPEVDASGAGSPGDPLDEGATQAAAYTGSPDPAAHPGSWAASAAAAPSGTSAGGPAGGSAGGGPAAGLSASGAPAAGAPAAAGRGSSSTRQESEHATRGSSSARLAATALGSARTRETGSRATRRVGTGSTRLREHRLGAGLTTVPPTTVGDPRAAVMAVPEVPEHKRYCPSCSAPVGRSREGVEGRTQGFCPQCGVRFDFTPQLAPGDLVGGQYEVVGCLAHGGLGWIYLAQDKNVSDRWVVLKGLLNAGDADAYAAAISERQFLAEVEHPLIVEIYNFAMHAGAGYTVMEFVGGPSLKELLTARRDANGGVPDPMSPEHALAYVHEVLPAFSYLHDKGLLFCDFKPDNVIQQGDGVKLIDLGGVRRVEDVESAIYGTVGFQAPEIASLGPSVASDVYTIGRTLATLVLDFRGNTTTYVAALPPVEDTPLFQRHDSLYRLLAKACAVDPSDRFGTIDEMRAQTLGVLREVVAARGGGGAAPTSASSVHFHPPVADVPDRPLHWDELPALRADDDDPGAGWLAGVNVLDPDDRVRALSAAPVESPEVRLARGRAAIEAGRPGVARTAIADMLADDPWEWRAAWLAGLVDLATGDAAGASRSFNAVYGQVPGELAPKLALATACEGLGELDVAEALYDVCARTDANYAAPAAFGMARIRLSRDDVDGALDALDKVGATRGSYVEARLRRARILAASGRGLPALAAALESVAHVELPAREDAGLRATVLASALNVVTSGTVDPGSTVDPAGTAGPASTVGGVPAQEGPLRDALERALRDVALLTDDHDERIRVVDRANTVRRWTLR
ncbi:serine/threonine-protein kinase PknG [Sediminihabitans luteus]|uniref:non-specific serine/threonine protein kinase n=1 Tax=Sediminihabitans luteus TaxID=1138585 RepID=A0A2M9CYE4_9CELL|nr:serine/threonine-protein kinase [Sediminihabitans luteus]PJJ76865.1 serine/threonine-protein kinase PknG [Sediminihabitans luteus]GIJ00345.1 serine/threonine protein kinase [Sediminihabitans luteus]